MKIFVLILMALIFTNVAISYVEYPTIIPERELPPYHSYFPSEADMKYHGTPSYYWTLTGSNFAIAGYFEPAKFGVNNDFRIKKIGCMGYRQDGAVRIYLFLAEVKGSRRWNPDCYPPEFNKKRFGPKDPHMNNSYPDYDDCDIYSDNWYLRKSDIDSQVNKWFWIVYHFPTSPPPYPLSDESTNSKNSCYYVPGTGWGSGG